jgi:hypothetical protein
VFKGAPCPAFGNSRLRFALEPQKALSRIKALHAFDYFDPIIQYGATWTFRFTRSAELCQKWPKAHSVLFSHDLKERRHTMHMRIMEAYGKTSHFKWNLRSINTHEITREDYANCYDEWGGSFIVHPDVLTYFEDVHGIKTRYRGYFRQSECVGAVPVWGDFIAGDYSALRACRMIGKVDFGYPAIYLPIDPQHRCTILYKSKYLLKLQHAQLAGSIFLGHDAKSMAILKKIPEELPSGKEFLVKTRRFERQDGIVRDVQEFSGEEVADIYTQLFHRRWDAVPHASHPLSETLSTLKKFLFGKILFIRETPIAIQLNFRADTRRTICIDYVNGGVDRSLRSLSPGALLHYINGCNACQESQLASKLLIYSYGKANAEYKYRWCHRIPRGLSGFWLPG